MWGSPPHAPRCLACITQVRPLLRQLLVSAAVSELSYCFGLCFVSCEALPAQACLRYVGDAAIRLRLRLPENIEDCTHASPCDNTRTSGEFEAPMGFRKFPWDIQELPLQLQLKVWRQWDHACSTRTHARTHARTRTHAHTHTHARTHTRTHTHAHTHTHARARARTHTHTHTHT